MISPALHFLPEAHNSAVHQGNKTFQKIGLHAGKLVGILGQAFRSPFVRLGKVVKEHARKNIGRASEKVEQTQTNLTYLKSIRDHIETTIQNRMSLIQATQIALEKEKATTQAGMQKLHGEISQKRFWTFPGKKAKMTRSYELLSQTLTTQNQKANALAVQYAGLEVGQRQIQALTPTIQREEVYLGTLSSTLNPGTLPDTITGLRDIAGTFAREQTHMLALSTIQIGNLGTQLMHMYRELEKSPSIVSTPL